VPDIDRELLKRVQLNRFFHFWEKYVQLMDDFCCTDG
jgi:hypothetical protein